MPPMSFSSVRPALEPNFNRATDRSRAVFFIVSILAYVAAMIAATLALHPYFSQTWDVATFIHAAQTFADDAHGFDLYAQSRAAQTWPYAYPPLHAFVTALALGIGAVFPVLPDYVWARAPMIAADIGVALVLYRIVRRKTADETLARTALLLWLFNPLTFYDTAVQGHFESEWLVFVLLAFEWFEQDRHPALPALALAVAFLFKQIAIVFMLPVFVAWAHRWLVKRTIQLPNLLLAALTFALVIGGVCLPFLLYSDDFWFMNLTYVENVPVQTQSWLVAVLGVTRATPNALASDFILLRHQTSVTMLATLIAAFVAARRGWSVYLAATVIALIFFLTSKKVMGYYYVMLFPFLFAEILPRRQTQLAGIALSATTYIALSPYYAAWTNHAHWWTYAILGSLNSAFFVWLGWQLLRRQNFAAGNLRAASVLALGLFAGAVGAALAQPLVASATSPIRAPIVAPGAELNAMVAFGGVLALIVLTLGGAMHATRAWAMRAPAWIFGVPLLFAPLFFSIYTLTKESTAIFEIALKALGV